MKRFSKLTVCFGSLLLVACLAGVVYATYTEAQALLQEELANDHISWCYPNETDALEHRAALQTDINAMDAAMNAVPWNKRNGTQWDYGLIDRNYAYAVQGTMLANYTYGQSDCYMAVICDNWGHLHQNATPPVDWNAAGIDWHASVEYHDLAFEHWNQVEIDSHVARTDAENARVHFVAAAQ